MSALPHLFADALAAAVVAGLAAVDRKGGLQLMLSRPIVLAAALGAVFGDPRGGLALGVPLELLFLGGVNLGGNLPDNETLLAGAVASAVVPAGLFGHGVDAPLAALGLAIFLPLAIVGRALDRAAEVQNLNLAQDVLGRVQRGDARAAGRNLRGLGQPFAITAAVCGACVLTAPLLAHARAALPPRLALGLEGSWHVVWALAAACAIRAIRHPRAPAVAALSAAAVGSLLLYLEAVP